MEAFNHISSNIDKIYNELTKSNTQSVGGVSSTHAVGGTAYLNLENPDEPYLYGIKYSAMPPTKRYRDMAQLSGGEKTVAALALLFAIHRYAQMKKKMSAYGIPHQLCPNELFTAVLVLNLVMLLAIHGIFLFSCARMNSLLPIWNAIVCFILIFSFNAFAILNLLRNLNSNLHKLLRFLISEYVDMTVGFNT